MDKTTLFLMMTAGEAEATAGGPPIFTQWTGRTAFAIPDQDPLELNFDNGFEVLEGDLGLLTVAYLSESQTNFITVNGYTARGSLAVQKFEDPTAYLIGMIFTRTLEADETIVTFPPNPNCIFPSFVLSRFRNLSYVSNVSGTQSSGAPDPPTATVQSGDWLVASAATQYHQTITAITTALDYELGGRALQPGRYTAASVQYKEDLAAGNENPGPFTATNQGPSICFSIVLRPE